MKTKNIVKEIANLCEKMRGSFGFNSSGTRQIFVNLIFKTIKDVPRKERYGLLKKFFEYLLSLSYHDNLPYADILKLSRVLDKKNRINLLLEAISKPELFRFEKCLLDTISELPEPYKSNLLEEKLKEEIKNKKATNSLLVSDYLGRKLSKDEVSLILSNLKDYYYKSIIGDFEGFEKIINSLPEPERISKFEELLSIFLENGNVFNYNKILKNHLKRDLNKDEVESFLLVKKPIIISLLLAGVDPSYIPIERIEDAILGEHSQRRLKIDISKNTCFGFRNSDVEDKREYEEFCKNNPTEAKRKDFLIKMTNIEQLLLKNK